MRSLEGKGFDGVATTEFSCDVWSSVPFIEGSKVTFNGYLLPDFYIAQQSYSGGVAFQLTHP